MWNTWFFFFLLFNPEPPATSILDLINPIPLEGSCKGSAIIEWQGDSKKESIQIVNETCNNAVLNFKKFLDYKKISYDENLNLSVNISVLDSGFKNKALNDPKRFTNGIVPRDSEGYVLIAHGYYSLKLKQIFIFNKIFINNKSNKFFKNALSHEVFHALIHQNNIKLPSEQEEVLAIQFSKFLGLW
jgi:hypothetical protein